ncbi:MAG: cytochrome d ubiquinol oxidase subunit II [Gemmatimonadales bacterium]
MSLTAADLLAGAILLAMTAYVLLAGADFGGGVWDLFAQGSRRERQRAVIANALGPVWEANHVWLILVVVLLFTCFPPAFSRIVIALHIPLTLILIGIVLRGSAFIFRSYGGQDSLAQRRWGRVFAISSLVTPLLLGVGVGAVAAGRVQRPSGEGFVADFVAPWLTPFAASVGGFTLALFAFLAAVYLTNETCETELREDFRRRALWSGGGVFVMALVTLVLAWQGAPLVWNGLVTAPGAMPFHLAVGVTATIALGALWQRRWRVARLAAVAQVSGILWGWALSQYPWMLPPSLSIADAAAPLITLKLTLGALGLGAIVLLPSLFYLFRIFKSKAQVKGVS